MKPQETFTDAEALIIIRYKDMTKGMNNHTRDMILTSAITDCYLIRSHEVGYLTWKLEMIEVLGENSFRLFESMKDLAQASARLRA